jgi:hypothetical protein
MGNNMEIIDRCILLSKIVRYYLSAFLLCSLIFTSACSRVHSFDVSYDPKITSDGEGGAIILYDIMNGSNQRDFYAQRVSQDGHKMWDEKGVLIGSAKYRSTSFSYLKIISDTHSGAIIGRMDMTIDRRTRLYQIIKIDFNGEILWQREVDAIEQMIGDGNGGVITAVDRESVIFVDKISPEGSSIWGENGISIIPDGYQNNSIKLVSDGAGGAIICWKESRMKTTRGSISILAQRINFNGSLLWKHNGVLIYTTPEGVSFGQYDLAAAYLGSSIIVWDVSITSGTSFTTSSVIYAQKLDAEGIPLWQTNGMSLKISRAADSNANFLSPLVVPDISGGAIISWRDTGNNTLSLYAQKLRLDGMIEWPLDGIKVFNIVQGGEAYYIQMVKDEGGGVIFSITFRDVIARSQGIQVYKLDFDGNIVWRVEPVNITINKTFAQHYTISDDEGEVILAWGTLKNDLSKLEEYFIQKIDIHGQKIWGEDGIKLGK